MARESINTLQRWLCANSVHNIRREVRDGRSEREEDGAGGGVSDAVAGGVAEVEEERVRDDAGAGHRGDESGLAETEREASSASRTSINCAATLTAIS